MALEDLEPQLPRFTSSNPNSWISQSEVYFQFYSIYGDERFSYVIEVFEDGPFYWFNSWFRSDDLTWSDFTTAMLHRFRSSSLTPTVDTIVNFSPPLSAIQVFDEMPDSIATEIDSTNNQTIDFEVLSIQTETIVVVNESHGVKDAPINISYYVVDYYVDSLVMNSFAWNPHLVANHVPVSSRNFGFDPGPLVVNTLYSARITSLFDPLSPALLDSQHSFLGLVPTFIPQAIRKFEPPAPKLFALDNDPKSPDPIITLTSISIHHGISIMVFRFQTHVLDSETTAILFYYVPSHSTRIFSKVLSEFWENQIRVTFSIRKAIKIIYTELQRVIVLIASPRFASSLAKQQNKVIEHSGRSIALLLFASLDVSVNSNKNLGALQSKMISVVPFYVAGPSNNSDFLSVDMNIIVVAESFSCSSVEEVWYLKGGYVETSTLEKFALHTSEILSDLSCVGTKQARFDIWLFMFISIKCEKMLRKSISEGSTHDVVFEIGHSILGSTSVVITQTVHYFDQPMGLFWNAHLAAVYIFNQSHTFVQASKGIVKTRLVYWVLKFQVGDKPLSWKGGTTMIIRYYTMWLWIRSHYSFSSAEVDFLGDRLHPNSVEWVSYCIPVAQRLLFPSVLPLKHSLTSNPFTFVQSATYMDVRLTLGTNTTCFCLVYSAIRAAALLHGEATVFYERMVPSTSRIVSITFWLGTTFWRRGGIWSFISNALHTSYKQVVVESIWLYGYKGLMLIYANKNCQELKEMDMRFTYYLIRLSTYGSKCQIQRIMISHSPQRLSYLAKCIQKVKYNHLQLESYWSWALHTFGLSTFNPKFYVDTTSKIDLSIAKRAFLTLSKTENESILVHVMLSFEALYGHKPPDNLLCLRHCILVAQQLEPATRFLLLNNNITIFPAQMNSHKVTT